MRGYLKDSGFWLAVSVVNLCCAPLVGIGRAIGREMFR